MPSGPIQESVSWFPVFAVSTTGCSPSSSNLLSWTSHRGRPCSRLSSPTLGSLCSATRHGRSEEGGGSGWFAYTRRRTTPLCRSLSAPPCAAARPRGPHVTTPRPDRSPTDPCRRPSACPMLHCTVATRAIAHVCVAFAPACRNLSATPLDAALLATMETAWALPQIRPSAAAMCLGIGSSSALQHPGPARCVCSSYAASLHVRACSMPLVAGPRAGPACVCATTAACSALLLA
jgi:hypothetical protein